MAVPPVGPNYPVACSVPMGRESLGERLPSLYPHPDPLSLPRQNARSSK